MHCSAPLKPGQVTLPLTEAEGAATGRAGGGACSACRTACSGPPLLHPAANCCECGGPACFAGCWGNFQSGWPPPTAQNSTPGTSAAHGWERGPASLPPTARNTPPVLSESRDEDCASMPEPPFRRHAPPTWLGDRSSRLCLHVHSSVCPFCPLSVPS